jgi:tetratricopeptide (TPR) repeat protein
MLADAEPSEHDTRCRRHAETFLALAETSEQHLIGEHQLEWLDRLGREHDNVRAVLDHAERTGRPEDVRDALRIAAATWRFWQQRGHLAEGRARLERLLALPVAATRDAVRARALGALGSLDYWAGDYPAMALRYREAAEIAGGLDDPSLLAEALYNLSFEWFLSGDMADAIPRLEQCLAVAPDGDVALCARASMSIGYTYFFRGDLPSALGPIERAVELLRASADQLALCEALISTAAVTWLMGEHERARTALAEATALTLAAPTPMLLAQIAVPRQILAVHGERYRDAAILQGMWERLEHDFEVTFPEVATSMFGDPAAEARAALSDDAFAEATAIGRAMDVEQMVEFLSNMRE